MKSPNQPIILYPYLIIILVLVAVHSLIIIVSADGTVSQKTAGPASAVFVFGDSTVDPGNNNYIGTPFKSNFPPYGNDFLDHRATGRFTNGRLVTDFIASYVGVKEYVPPYLDPSLSMEELMSGVSFASAGSGFDPLTATITQVIPVIKQVDYFKEFINKIDAAIGKDRRQSLIRNAVFIVSASTNDYVLNYYGPPIRRKAYTISAYHQFLVQIIHQFLQDLVELGAEKILMAGIPPMECLPLVITISSLHLDASPTRNCIHRLSSVALDHNQLLQQTLMDIRSTHQQLHLLYIDIHNPLLNILRNFKTLGFEDINSGCCGSGLLETSFLCNPKSTICSDASTYVFFDSIHPTEKAYYLIFKDICSTIDLLTKG